MSINKFLTHYYKITIREDSKWCFKMEGWRKKSYEQLLGDYKTTLLIAFCYIILVLFVQRRIQMKKINNVDMNGKKYAIALVAGVFIYEVVKWFGWVDIGAMIVSLFLSAFVLLESYIISGRLYRGFKNNVWEVTLHTNRKLDTFMRWLWIAIGVLLLTETKLIESVIGVGLIYTSIATFYLKKKCEE